MPNIMICGEILVEVMTENIDQSFLEPGPLIGPFPSGAPAIFISQVALTGSNCGIISQVGDDDFGLLNINRLVKDGVDTTGINISRDLTTGTAFVTYFKDGSRKFIFHFKEAACGHLEPAQIDSNAFQDCKYFHIMGCSLAASPSMRASVMHCFNLAKSSGAKISFDPNLRPELLNDDSIRETYEHLLAEADILLTGRSEIENLFAGTAAADAVAKLLNSKSDRIIVIKDGSKGVQVHTKDDSFSIPSFPVVEVDPTGAGDCFDGAFVSCLDQGKTIREAAVIANMAGALGVTVKGPMQGNSTLEKIQTELAKHKL